MVFLEPQLNCEGCFSSEIMITLGNITEIVRLKESTETKIKIKNVPMTDQKVYILDT